MQVKKSFNRYSYCLNNPLKYTDPTGQRYVDDIWDFDENGNFIGRIKTKEFDQIRIWDKDRTNILAETDKFAYRTITQHKQPIANVEGTPTLLDIFRIQGDDAAKQVFEMFATNTYGYKPDGTRTNLEWSHTKIGLEGSGSNMVGTSHSTNSTAVGDYLFKTNYTMRYDAHNHPSGYPLPSFIPGDIGTTQPWVEKFQNLQLYIYIKEGSIFGAQQGYYRYDQSVRGVIVKP